MSPVSPHNNLDNNYCAIQGIKIKDKPSSSLYYMRDSIRGIVFRYIRKRLDKEIPHRNKCH